MWVKEQKYSSREVTQDSESDCCGTDISKLADGDSQKAGDEGTESENV